MTDVATLLARLAEAEGILHKLRIGKTVQEIRHGQNEQMRFIPTDVAKLESYIADLKGQLRAAGVPVTGGRGRARRLFF